MVDFLSGIFNQLDLFILIILRISGYVFTSPIFGRKEIPNLSKIGVCLFLTYILFNIGKPTIAVIPAGLGQFVVLCIFETLKGMLMGILNTIFFTVFIIAGQLIDTEVGFRMGGLLDPMYGVKIPLTGNLFNIAAFVVFLNLNGHLHMINILSDTYVFSPVGSAFAIENIASIFTSAFSLAYLFAIKIALPLVLIIIFIDVILGIMIKFIPQMNIFVIGIPLKLLVGVFALFYLVSPLVNFFSEVFNSMYTFVSQLYL